MFAQAFEGSHGELALIGGNCGKCAVQLCLAPNRLSIGRARNCRDSQTAEVEIGGVVVPLQAQVARFEPAAAAGIGIVAARIGPIGDLHAVDPDGEVGLVGNQRAGEPGVVIGNDPAGFGAAVDRAGSGVDGIGAVPVLEAVLDLQLIAVGRGLFCTGFARKNMPLLRWVPLVLASNCSTKSAKVSFVSRNPGPPAKWIVPSATPNCVFEPGTGCQPSRSRPSKRSRVPSGRSTILRKATAPPFICRPMCPMRSGELDVSVKSITGVPLRRARIRGPSTRTSIVIHSPSPRKVPSAFLRLTMLPVGYLGCESHMLSS